MSALRPTSAGAVGSVVSASGSRHLPLRYLVALGLIVSIVSVAWGFAGIEGELRLRDQGLAFNDADLALDAASASRSHLGEALRVAALGDQLAGDDVARVEATALALAEEALRQFEFRSDLVAARTDAGGFAEASEAYHMAAVAVATALRAGDLGTADALFSRDVVPAHGTVVGILAELRAESLGAFTRGDGSSYVLGLITRLLLAVAVPIVAIVVIYDSMRRRQRQRELELALRSERDLSRSKDEFIANVSHELRTPLTIVHGFARVLEEEETLPSHVADAAAYIARESDELTRMVDDLLTAARTDAGALTIRVEPVPVRQAVAAVVGGMSSDGETIEVDVEAAYVYADAFRLRQIVRNLLSNARKHGGDSIRVTGAVDRDDYVLVVADDGPGVDPSIEAQVFDRFVHGGQDRMLAGSVGLGLAIVESLVHRMNGSVVYDRVGRETRFTVRIPLSPVGYEYRAGELVLDDVGEAR